MHAFSRRERLLPVNLKGLKLDSQVTKHGNIAQNPDDSAGVCYCSTVEALYRGAQV